MANTVVSATLTGADGLPLAGVSFLVSLTNSAGVSFDALPYTVQTASIPVSEFSGVLDATGSLSIALAPNSLVTGSFWQFTIGPSNTASGFTYLATITGATQSLTTQLSAAAINNVPRNKAFALSLINASSQVASSNRFSLPNWRLALSQVQLGLADARLMCIGDSTTIGFGSSLYLTYAAAQSYPSALGGLLRASGIAAADGLAVPTNGAVADNRWTVGSGWQNALAGGVNNNPFGAANQGTWVGTNPGGSVVFTPNGSGTVTTTYDSFDLYYVASATFTGSITATATGGTPVVANTHNAAGPNIYKVTATAAAANTTNTLTMTGTGNVWIIGVEPFNSAVTRVRVANTGEGGATTDNWSNPTLTAYIPYQSGSFITAYNPDLSIISLGINDAGLSVPLATYTANVQTIINSAKAMGDVILMSFAPSSGLPYTTFETQYLAALKTLADTNNVPFVDIYGGFGSTFQTGFMFNTLHPNSSGYYDIASSVNAFLQTIN